MPAWFMWFQVGSCLIGAVGYAYQGQWSLAWTWLMYSSANLGFVSLAGGFK